MNIKTYKTSFTTGGLYFREAVKIAELYLMYSDWKVVRAKALEGNYLQARTERSLERTTREVIQRIQTLTQEQLSLLVEGNITDQKQILWLAVCKHYSLVHEFAVQVIREKYLRLEKNLDFVDWDSFFNSKAEWHDELDQLTSSTKDKLRQVIFRILHEADILSSDNSIQSTLLSPRVIHAIRNENAEWFTIYPSMEKL